MGAKDIFFKFLLIFSAVGFTSTVKAQIIWHNPLSDTFTPHVMGRAWNDEIPGSYQRLPARVRSVVSPSLWRQSQQSSGLYIRFVSDATTLVIRYQVNKTIPRSHATNAEVTGVDLYRTDVHGTVVYCEGDCSFGDTIVYTYSPIRYDAAWKERGYLYTLYLPLCSEVKWMEIGTKEDAMFFFSSPSHERPVVIYGSAVAQGAYALRPGQACGNLLQRRMDIPVVNWGFSGNGKMEKEIFHLLSEVDAKAYVIDCLPDMTNGELCEEIPDRLSCGIHELRKKRSAPILIVEQPECVSKSTRSGNKSLSAHCKKLQRAVYERLKDSIPELFYLTEEELFLQKDVRQDSTSGTDWEMAYYADACEKKLRGMLFPNLGKECLAPVRQRRECEWGDRHDLILDYNAAKEPKIVLLGNSITDFWGGEPQRWKTNGAKAWRHCWGRRNVVNMGLGWDYLENVKWRILHGELDGFNAEKIFLLIGINNLNKGDKCEYVAQGIEELVRLIQLKQPKAMLYVEELLPCRNKLTQVKTVNALLSRILHGKTKVTLVPTCRAFLRNDGTFNASLFLDGLHPTEKGYEVLAKTLKPYIKE